MMRSQDILIMLKIISLQQHDIYDSEEYSVRALAASTGIGKSIINRSIRRSKDVSLIRLNRNKKRPEVNRNALFMLIESAVKYIFPANPGEIGRGFITSFDAPVLEGIISSLGENKYVWPDAHGQDQGQKIEPLYKAAPIASRNDDNLYKMLALVDAIRLGNPREAGIAKKRLLKAITV